MQGHRKENNPWKHPAIDWLCPDIPHVRARATLVAGLAALAAGEPGALDVLREAAVLHEAVAMEADRLESLSALAVGLVDAGDVPAALDAVREVLRGLSAGVAPGSLTPGRVLADCYRVLESAGDPGRADVARRAGEYLEAQSRRIRDDRLRAGFASTPVNVELARIAALG
jgi:hypothetical protein